MIVRSRWKRGTWVSDSILCLLGLDLYSSKPHSNSVFDLEAKSRKVAQGNAS